MTHHKHRKKSHKKHKRSQKAGAPPGTLMHVGETKQEKVRISVIRYDDDFFDEQVCHDPKKIVPPGGDGKNYWINVDGVHDSSIIEEICETFNIHPLVQEDLMNTEQRPKVEDYGDYLFIVIKMFYKSPENGDVETEQVSLILGQDFLLSWQEREGDVFEGVRERLRTSKGRVRRMEPDYLCYLLMDMVMDKYFVILEVLSDKIEALEDELLDKPGPDTLQRIYEIKRELVVLRKSVWPLREVGSTFQRLESTLVSKDVHLYLRDFYDHAVQVIDSVETFRDSLSSMVDIYLSSTSNKMNEIMKVLTVISSIFIPMTFVTGFYGMNFETISEHPEHFIWVIISMILIFIIQLTFFKVKKWL